MPPKTHTGRRPHEVARHLRETAGMSQRALARAASISATLMSEIEAGKRGLTPQVLRRIAAALSVDPTDIDPDATDVTAGITEPLLRVPEVARRLGASRPTVYRLLAAGELDRVDIGTGSRPCSRVPESSLRAYIESKTVPGRRAAKRAA